MLKLILVFTLFSVSFFVQSNKISVKVLTQERQRVGNVVVYLTPKASKVSAISNKIEIMDQVNTQFSPHILAVQKDTQVRFPNSDSIKHHVYSFSQAKTFELQLYKELQADPLLFSNTGAVELGCNIHDWMLGYIFVVDTPYFGKTDSEGNLTLELPDGDYQLDVWHPRIQDKFSVLSRPLSLPATSDIEIVLSSPLLPDVNQYEDISGEFSDYE
ncbi:methylamine utilization protein [Paraglaciecola arctica]|nr:methylamine utilization protein [Paraglaciecola arctica]MBU3004061.1 methylamine utilization protein [Paraglaciecola arctica]